MMGEQDLRELVAGLVLELNDARPSSPAANPWERVIASLEKRQLWEPYYVVAERRRGSGQIGLALELDICERSLRRAKESGNYAAIGAAVSDLTAVRIRLAAQDRVNHDAR